MLSLNIEFKEIKKYNKNLNHKNYKIKFGLPAKYLSVSASVEKIRSGHLSVVFPDVSCIEYFCLFKQQIYAIDKIDSVNSVGTLETVY